MITLPEIEKFVTALSEKGYNGQFYAPQTGMKDLTFLLIAYRDAHSQDKKIAPFPPVIGTFIGKPQGDERTICTLSLQHDPAQGLHVSGILVTRYDLRTTQNLREHRLVVASMHTMPTMASANALVVPTERQQKKKRKGRSR